MNRTFTQLSVLVFFAALFLGTAHAQPVTAKGDAAKPSPAAAPVLDPAVLADPFQVRGISVDVTGASVVEARQKAFEEARRKAYVELATRMHDGHAPAETAIPTAGAIAAIVKSLKVHDERMAKDRYKAAFDVSFRKSALGVTGGHLPKPPAAPKTAAAEQDAAVADMSDEAKQPEKQADAAAKDADAAYSPSDQPAQAVELHVPYLVLAWMGRPGHQTIWGTNPWRDAWERQSAMSAKSGRFLVPVGDLEDMRDYNPIQPLVAVSGAEQLRKRYQAEDVVVAIAEPLQGRLGITLYVLRDGMMRKIDTLSIAQGLDRRFDDAVESVNEELAHPTKPKAPQDTTDTKDEPADRPVSDGNTAASTDTSTNAKNGSGLPVTVHFSSLQQWVAIKRAIGMVPGVAGYSIRGVTSQDARLVVSFVGDTAQAQSAFATKNLVLSRSGDGWTLAQAGAY